MKTRNFRLNLRLFTTEAHIEGIIPAATTLRPCRGSGSIHGTPFISHAMDMSVLDLHQYFYCASSAWDWKCGDS